MADIDNNLRAIELSDKDISLMNPNTMTCPIFRTIHDGNLTKKLYNNFPVLMNDVISEDGWNISFSSMFHMSNDSHLFKDSHVDDSLPLYEAKLFYHFDHRYTTYEGATEANLKAGILPQISSDLKSDSYLTILPKYWVCRKDIKNENWTHKWYLTFRSITSSISDRSFISTILPECGIGNSAIIIYLDEDSIHKIVNLLGNFNSLVFDYILRQKIGGNNLNLFIVKQLPIIPPNNYSDNDNNFIKTRVLELVYTSHDIKSFAVDMGYDGEPFLWDEERRAVLRAELDAYYAKLYGLNRDELRYILDPQDVYGEDFPGETFRVLKENEIRKYGEYRTRRLVLEAWDRLWG